MTSDEIREQVQRAIPWNEIKSTISNSGLDGVLCVLLCPTSMDGSITARVPAQVSDLIPPSIFGLDVVIETLSEDDISWMRERHERMRSSLPSLMERLKERGRDPNEVLLPMRSLFPEFFTWTKAVAEARGTQGINLERHIRAAGYTGPLMIDCLWEFIVHVTEDACTLVPSTWDGAPVHTKALDLNEASTWSADWFVTVFADYHGGSATRIHSKGV